MIYDFNLAYYITNCMSKAFITGSTLYMYIQAIMNKYSAFSVPQPMSLFIKETINLHSVHLRSFMRDHGGKRQKSNVFSELPTLLIVLE